MATRVARWRALLPAMSVALCVLALPPFAWWPLALVQWVPLIYWCARETPGRAAAGAALTGLALGLYLYFGAAVLDMTTLLLASGALGAALAIFGAAVPFVFRHAGVFAPYALGALWASVEIGLAGARLPFSLALTLTAQPAALQAAAIGGSALVAAMLVAMQCAWTRCAMPQARLPHWRVALSTLLLGGVLTVLGNAHRPAASHSIVAAAAQTDLHPFWYVHAEADGHLRHMYAQRDALRTQAAAARPDLLVWPEVPFARFALRNSDPDRIEGVAELVAGNDLGVRGEQFNAVIGIDRNGTVQSRHTKSVLLPRLEKQYRGGDSARPHDALPGRPGSLICFESAFASPARDVSLRGAGILTIATSDAYAGPSALASLHGAFAILRAVENRRAVVRSANGGPSMIVSERGHVLAQSTLFSPQMLVASVNVISNPSLYARHAHLFELTFVALGVIPLLLAVIIEQRTGSTFSSGPGLPGSALALVITSALLIGAQVHHHATLYARAHNQTQRPAPGFVDTLDTNVSYAELGAATRAGDLAGATAALLRRFGIDQSAAGVSAQIAQLDAHSVFRVDATSLAEVYGLSTTPWNASLEQSTIPCVAELNDQSVVLITRMDGTAVEMFSPAEAAFSSVPRRWLSSALRGDPTCVIGRTYAWDLGS